MANQETRIGRRPKWPMSAYRASAPVITRTTAPMAMNAVNGWSAMNDTANVGDSPSSTPGCPMMCGTPSTASTTNQMTMTGPNSLPTWCVPKRCTANSRARMTTPIGSTASASSGCATSRPSTADSTEIAGVMSESP